MSKIRVIIADDDNFVRDGMRIILSVDEEFEVVGCAADGKEAVELATKHDTDIILMDIHYNHDVIIFDTWYSLWIWSTYIKK